ncbi:MAG TPA: hypothetical protein VIO62_06540 [Candidatus Dormibacteraeota bacterium]
MPGAIARKTVMPASVGEWNRPSTNRTSASCIICEAVRASITPVASLGKVGIRNSCR